MMRPGAGQNYPRSGFPLEGKAAPGLLPLGKVRIAPCREARTKQPPPRPAESRRTEGSPARPHDSRPRAVSAAVLRRGWIRALSRDGQGWGRCAEGLAAGRRLWPRTPRAVRTLRPAGAGGTDREVGGVSGP